MLKKVSGKLRKSSSFAEGTSSDDFHVHSFNILTQSPPQKSAKKETDSFVKSKVQKDKKNEAKERGSLAKGKKRKEKLFKPLQNLILTLLMK